MSPVPAALPHSFMEAATRGALCKCPRCGEGRLFRRWLKPVDRCAACRMDWTPQHADDFPAYISIFLTGHITVPLLVTLVLEYDLSALAAGAIIVPLSIALMLALIQPAKGAVIAAQWWLALGDFRRERPTPPGNEP
ncbi:MAG TPA: DUF983 domain-containing protein [Croceibacterium sp.]|nr:DUF983 domain-containing protein [Croceibacterium sp.]